MSISCKTIHTQYTNLLTIVKLKHNSNGSGHLLIFLSHSATNQLSVNYQATLLIAE